MPCGRTHIEKPKLSVCSAAFVVIKRVPVPGDGAQSKPPADPETPLVVKRPGVVFGSRNRSAKPVTELVCGSDGSSIFQCAVTFGAGRSASVLGGFACRYATSSAVSGAS